MDTLSTFWDNIARCKTKRVHFLGLMNSATKCRRLVEAVRALGMQGFGGGGLKTLFCFGANSRTLEHWTLNP